MILALLFACADKGGAGSGPSDSASVEDGAPWFSALGAPADALGNAVAAAGDLSGDGVGDLLATAYLGNRVCAVFGPQPAGAHALDALSPACLQGETELDYAGYAALAADWTGDGIADVLAGSIGNGDAGANAGKVYLVLGPLEPGTTRLDAAASAVWRGETTGDYAGVALAAGADLTGDGEADLLVGASGYDGEGGGGGRAYLVAGPLLEASAGLAEAYASVTGLGVPTSEDTGDTIVPPPPPHGAFGTGDFVGDAMAGDQDLDGDGVADLALGASGDQTNGLNAGKLAVFWGPIASGVALVTDADLLLYGEVAGGYLGSPLRAVADLTGDGAPELLVASDAVGAGWVYGLDLRAPPAAIAEAPLRFEGEADGGLFGSALSGAADLDGDGALDLAIGAPWAAVGEDAPGVVYVFAGPFEPGLRSAADAMRLTGAHDDDVFGGALEMVPGVGDGTADLLVGARNDRTMGGFAGAVHLFDLAG